MPRYLVTSEGPINVRPIERPDMPGWTPEHPWEPGPGLPSLPPRDEWPELPPREEWPPLPPWFQEHPGNPLPLPIPPNWGNPSVPLPPDPEIDPPPVWPPLPELPDLPDLSGKMLVLARFYISRHVNFLRWIVIDTEEAMEKAKAALETLKGRLPAGGVGGRPPQTRPPG